MSIPSSQGNGRQIFLGRRLFSLPTLVSFGIAAALIAFLLTRFDVDLGATWNTIRGGNILFYLLAILVHYLTFPFRGARWRMLLQNTAEEPQRVPSAWRCGGLILLGWFANSVSWFRLGDAYRAYAYTEETGARFPRTIGTVVAERVLDVVLVFALIGVAALILAYGDRELPSWQFLVVAAGLLAMVALGLLAMVLLRQRLTRLLPGPLARAYAGFYHGTLGSLRRLPMVSLWGLLGWLAEVARLYLVVKALGLDLGVEMVLFATLANAILTLVPFTPGGLGIVETGLTGLLALVLSRQEAVAVAVLDRSISYLSIVVVGGLFFATRQIILSRRRRLAKASPPPPG